MNIENWNKWINELRTTTKRQAKGALCRVSSETGERAYCCLGLGSELVPGIPEVEESSDILFGEYGNKALAPPEFIEWLGLDHYTEESDNFKHEYNLTPDYPGNLVTPDQCRFINDAGLNAAGMNDGGFTFAQIGDVFAYFGVRSLVIGTDDDHVWRAS